MTAMSNTKKVRRMKKERRVLTTTRKENPWLAFVKAFAAEHPDLKYRDVLTGAKLTYVRVAPRVRAPGTEKRPNPWMLHVANWKNEHPDWKTGTTYKEVLKLCKETYSKQAV
jgi:hypothetical protein